MWLGGREGQLCDFIPINGQWPMFDGLGRNTIEKTRDKEV